MLSPKRQFILLPQDREIMAATGMTEEEYRWFVKEAIKNSKIRPSDPVAIDPLTLTIINLALGLLLTGVAYLITPKPSQEKDNEVKQKPDVDGQDIVRRDRYTPKTGFDSVQQVVELGSVIPIIYAKREGQFGGIRVNTNMLWSQLLSVGGGQFIKTLHLISEGGRGFRIDEEQTAMGNNLLGSYELRKNATTGRVTFYFDATGGRLSSNDYELGVIPENDPGASYPSDIYTFETQPYFCQAVLPSNQTEFGVYSIIGNNLGYKLGESFKPQVYHDVIADEGRFDNQALVDAMKESMCNSTRAGLIRKNGVAANGLVSLAEDDTVTYKIYSSSFEDAELETQRSQAGDQPPGVARFEDIASSIASAQRNYDELINVGDFYKIGSAIGVCIQRSGDNFISEAELTDDGKAQDVEAVFRIIEPGRVHIWPESTLDDDDPRERNGVLGTTHSHIFRVAVGSFTVERPSIAIELGIESQLGVRSSGITNFNSLVARDNWKGVFETTKFGDDYELQDYSWQAFVNAEYIGGTEPGSGKSVKYSQTNLSGTYSANDERYSFFRIGYRTADQSRYTYSSNLYGVRSQTGVSVYNFMRFEFGDTLRREFRIIPISGWEVRTGEAAGNLYVIDWHQDEYISVSDFGVEITFSGKQLQRDTETFGIQVFQVNEKQIANEPQLGMTPPDDEEAYYVDAYARLAEAFIYDAVDSTAGDAEHRISYVNVVTNNDETPTYKNMALLGMNIRSSKEIRSLSQVSVYVTRGVIDSHLFPDVLYDLLTKNRYGTGTLYDERQIDKDSFDYCARWTNERGYYFDGAVSEKRNLRSWGIEVAQNFLLDLSVASGVFKLKPSLNFDGPEPVEALFTAGNIIEDTFGFSYLDVQDRIDPVVTVKWREERLPTGLKDRGLFPQVREITVARVGVSDNNPVTQIDLSNYATNQRHAIDRAKLECQLRHYVTHAVSFKTLPTQATIQPGSIIKVGMETIKYEQPQNGAVTVDGTVTAWTELGDGSYKALIWDGRNLQEGTIEIGAGKCISHSSVVFCLQDSTNEAQTYKVQSVTFDEDGNVDVEAIYWPTNRDGLSKLVEDWNDGNFQITGKIQ